MSVVLLVQVCKSDDETYDFLNSCYIQPSLRPWVRDDSLLVGEDGYSLLLDGEEGEQQAKTGKAEPVQAEGERERSGPEGPSTDTVAAASELQPAEAPPVVDEGAVTVEVEQQEGKAEGEEEKATDVPPAGQGQEEEEVVADPPAPTQPEAQPALPPPAPSTDEATGEGKE